MEMEYNDIPFLFTFYYICQKYERKLKSKEGNQPYVVK